jgi:hypothetical protein
MKEEMELARVLPERGPIFTRIEALGYRCLRYVSQPLRPFQILIGPNASGKSTFLDVVGFLADLTRDGLEAAVASRTADPKHLVWMRTGGRFELAVETSIPPALRAAASGSQLDTCRYELAVDGQESLRIVGENLWLKPDGQRGGGGGAHAFPEPEIPPGTILKNPRKTPPAWKKVVARGSEPRSVLFVAETTGWNSRFRLRTDRGALGSLPDDSELFPVATWFRATLQEGVRRIVLASDAMRRPSPPGRPRSLLTNGANLPWLVDRLQQEPQRFNLWLEHLREALPEVETVETGEQMHDRAKYLVLTNRNGLKAFSWMCSDGTLRLLALTLLPFLGESDGTYLIEEPENGIHPQAIETVFQSLSSVYQAQVLCASHSPVLLAMSEPAQLLCFARGPAGETAVVAGSEHPRLEQWKGAVDLGTFLAGGVLS